MIGGAGRAGNVGRTRARSGGGGASAGKTYDQWVTQAAVLAPVAVPWATLGYPGNATRRTTVAVPDVAGNMRGTTWASLDGPDTDNDNVALARMIQHAFPTQAAFDENVAANRVVVYTVGQFVFPASFNGILRNGYGSNNGVAVGGSAPMTLFYFWNAVTGRVEFGNPSTAGPFTEYSWP